MVVFGDVDELAAGMQEVAAHGGGGVLGVSGFDGGEDFAVEIDDFIEPIVIAAVGLSELDAALFQRGEHGVVEPVGGGLGDGEVEGDVGLAEGIEVALGGDHAVDGLADGRDLAGAAAMGGEAGAFGLDENAEIDEFEEVGFPDEGGVGFDGRAEGVERWVCDVGAGAFEGAQEAAAAQLLDGFADDGAAGFEAGAEFFLGGEAFTGWQGAGEDFLFEGAGDGGAESLHGGRMARVGR